MQSGFFEKNKQPQSTLDFGSESCDTPLHRILRSSASVREVEKFIDVQGKEKCSLMAKRQDDRGMLPIEIIKDNDALVNLIKPLTVCTDLKALTEPTSTPDLKDFKMNETLSDNLQTGRFISDIARETIKRSPAHDMARGVSSRIVDRMAGEMNSMRQAMLRKHRSLLGARPDLSSIENQELSLNTVSSFPKEEQIGNCYEFCFVALKQLRERNQHDFAQVLKITSRTGAHNVLCFGHNPGEKISDLLKPTSNAVICDPWAGEVYPSFLIPKMLKTYSIIELNYGEDCVATVPFYDSRFNQIDSEFNCLAPKPKLSPMGRGFK